MAIITTIAGIPLYDNLQEALAWAAANNLTGYHLHNWQGQQGYMGGANHQQATGMPINTNAPRSVTPQPRSTTVRRSTSSGGSTGGGY